MSDELPLLTLRQAVKLFFPGNMTQCAELLGIEPRTFYRWVREDTPRYDEERERVERFFGEHCRIKWKPRSVQPMSRRGLVCVRTFYDKKTSELQIRVLTSDRRPVKRYRLEIEAFTVSGEVPHHDGT